MAPMLTSAMAEGEQDKSKKAKLEGAGDVIMFSAMGGMFGPIGIAAGGAIGGLTALGKISKAVAEKELDELKSKTAELTEEFQDFQDSTQKLQMVLEKYNSGLSGTN